MAVVSNKNFSGAPMLPVGRTGKQSYKFVPGPRFYVKEADATVNTPVQQYFTKSNGITPPGWTDLGIVDGDLTVGYQVDLQEVRTGVDNVLRDEYVKQKTASFEATLSQFDDIVIETLTGATPSVIVPGSIVKYPLGSTDILNLAVLLVVQNKLNGKEIQYYNPDARITLSFEKSGDYQAVKVTGAFPGFVPAGASYEEFISTTIFA